MEISQNFVAFSEYMNFNSTTIFTFLYMLPSTDYLFVHFRLLSQTTDGSGGNLKDNHKQFTTDPSTRYRQIPKKIDHDHILPLYETDSPEEFEFLKEKFLKRQYYSREEHKKLLYRAKRKVFKRVTAKIIMPIRAANAFRRQQSGKLILICN
jgi:hypothetical protein